MTAPSTAEKDRLEAVVKSSGFTKKGLIALGHHITHPNSPKKIEKKKKKKKKMP